jgi:hypothetical protein
VVAVMPVRRGELLSTDTDIPLLSTAVVPSSNNFTTPDIGAVTTAGGCVVVSFFLQEKRIAENKAKNMIAESFMSYNLLFQ